MSTASGDSYSKVFQPPLGDHERGYVNRDWRVIEKSISTTSWGSTTGVSQLPVGGPGGGCFNRLRVNVLSLRWVTVDLLTSTARTLFTA